MAVEAAFASFFALIFPYLAVFVICALFCLICPLFSFISRLPS